MKFALKQRSIGLSWKVGFVAGGAAAGRRLVSICSPDRWQPHFSLHITVHKLLQKQTIYRTIYYAGKRSVKLQKKILPKYDSHTADRHITHWTQNFIKSVFHQQNTYMHICRFSNLLHIIFLRMQITHWKLQEVFLPTDGRHTWYNYHPILTSHCAMFLELYLQLSQFWNQFYFVQWPPIMNSADIVVKQGSNQPVLVLGITSPELWWWCHPKACRIITSSAFSSSLAGGTYGVCCSNICRNNHQAAADTFPEEKISKRKDCIGEHIWWEHVWEWTCWIGYTPNHWSLAVSMWFWEIFSIISGP